jgi:predicted 3-demethylubiquinone-9 3-methyltransferase (glyoxalase superfamily)
MQKISTHLWYDKEAKEAAEFYTSIFDNSKIIDITTLHDTPSGDVDSVTVEIEGQKFTLLSAGPFFKFTPAISFTVACKTKEEVDGLWEKLSKDGKVLMELGTYPFSERYGWAQDKFGLSWQIICVETPIKQKITPMLLFANEVCGKAEEAMNFYAKEVFHNSSVDFIFPYGEGQEPDKAGTVMHGTFTLEGKEFAAMDSAHEHKFTFNEAISFMVHCDTQDEIDYYWEKLSAVPESEQCGWLKDKYGVSWQIVPTAMDEMMKTKDEKKLARVTQAFLKMKKFNLKELQAAYDSDI